MRHCVRQVDENEDENGDDYDDAHLAQLLLLLLPALFSNETGEPSRRMRSSQVPSAQNSASYAGQVGRGNKLRGEKQ